jgi:hypothetical protein
MIRSQQGRYDQNQIGVVGLVFWCIQRASPSAMGGQGEVTPFGSVPGIAQQAGPRSAM